MKKKKAALTALLVTALGLFLPVWNSLEGAPAVRPVREGLAIAAEPFERPLLGKRNLPGRVVLVVLDGVRWQDVFLGVDPELARTTMLPSKEAVPIEELIPTLHRLTTDDGVAFGAPEVGEAMFASGPNFVSQPGYIELFSERLPTGCRSNRCAATTEPTLVDAIANATNGSVAVIASWEVIAKTATASPKDIVMSAGQARGENQSQLRVNAQATRALDMGRIAAAWPGHGEYRPDRYTAELALAYLEAKRPRFLFLGLGDTDEYAHMGDYRGYLRALHAADATIGQLLQTLDRMGDDGRHTTVLITTDHGRERGFTSHGEFAPESARVWMIAGGNVRPLGPVALDAPAHLYDVGPTVRALMDLPPAEGDGRALFGRDESEPESAALAPAHGAPDKSTPAPPTDRPD